MPVYEPKTKNPAIAGLLKDADRAPRPFERRLLGVDDANKLPVFRALLLELDVPVFFREQGVVAAKSDIHSRVKMRAALPNYDVARNNFLAAVDFDA